MFSRHLFAFAAAAALWAMPAFAWEPEVIGLDDRTSPSLQLTAGAVDGVALVTPEMVGSDRQEPATPKDAGSSERLARECTCR